MREERPGTFRPDGEVDDTSGVGSRRVRIATQPSSRGAAAYTETLFRTPQAAAPARQLTTTALGTWDLSVLNDAAATVVSELVGNAAIHARGAVIRVTVTRVGERRVRIAVVDKDPVLPVLRDIRPDDTNGRGLRMVDALSVRWGVDVLRWGKRVWSELETG
ncbi:ATP-binding protein [Streptomyces sp. NPDC003077]|uniref:ATP-binding protein n=1 Tax=Streptomyces sp. NPDC003077 TaxID=3154443 RepID=UPI0033B89246